MHSNAQKKKEAINVRLRSFVLEGVHWRSRRACRRGSEMAQASAKRMTYAKGKGFSLFAAAKIVEEYGKMMKVGGPCIIKAFGQRTVAQPSRVCQIRCCKRCNFTYSDNSFGKATSRKSVVLFYFVPGYFSFKVTLYWQTTSLWVMCSFSKSGAEYSKSNSPR